MLLAVLHASQNPFLRKKQKRLSIKFLINSQEINIYTLFMPQHSFPSHMSCTENTSEDQLAHQGHISPRASIFSIADDDVQFLAKKKSVRMFRGVY